eukprot:16083636-Heterocapsa_arctica.AAC.1
MVLEHVSSETVHLFGRDRCGYVTAGPRICIQELLPPSGGAARAIAFDFAGAPSLDRSGRRVFGEVDPLDVFKVVGTAGDFHFNFSEIQM